MIAEQFYNKLKPTEKKFFNVTIIIVVLALFDRLFLGPFGGKLKQINEDIERQEIIVKRDLRFLAYEDKILKENEAFKNYFSKSIEDDDVVNAAFLREIERIATKTNVNLVKSNPSNSKKEKRYNAYYANLDCTGKLENIITFMHAIDTTDSLLKIVKFNMTPKRNAKDEVNASMTILKMIIIPQESIPSS